MRTLDRRKFSLGMMGLGTVGLAAPARAACLPTVGEKPVLTIDGKIDCVGPDGLAKFSLPMLEKIGMTSFATNTPWYSGPMTFEGIPMTALMALVGAKGAKLTAVALNDYTTEIPISDFAQYKPILALKRNGVYMPVKDKGPLFIVYPYDSDSELKSQKYYSRSAWQVARLTVS
ncbi:MAG: oxidoreductase [Proteobacteria bacterium]|nr:oxidoreductase [Pseudomonadota bacterium]